METASFRITPVGNERQTFVQFKSFTAENYEKIKQRERTKERGDRDTSKGAPLLAERDHGSQTSDVDITLTSGMGWEETYGYCGHGQELQTFQSHFNNGAADLELTDLWAFRPNLWISHLGSTVF